MKKLLAIFFILIFISFLMPSIAEDNLDEIINSVEIESKVKEIDDIELGSTENDTSESEFIEYDYEVDLSNVNLFNIVALNDANLKGDYQGNIWIGSTLTGTPIVNGNDNYVYNDLTNSGYLPLTIKSTENTRKFWIDLMNDLPNGDELFIYIEPDENDVAKVSGNNKAIYWTNATTVSVDSFTGYLIAPYADIYVNNNFSGTIVGWNITNQCNASLTDFNFNRPKPQEKVTTPPATITVTKTIVGNMWHVRCDIMDTTTFEAGGGKWKRDVISNPGGNTSQEGHRSNKCGDDDHWIIWVDTEGNPYRMDEIKSGATGSTLPTIIYKPRYELTTEEIQNMTADDFDLVYKYSQNFIDPMPWTEIKIGERLYWTTTDKGRIWYHSGIPYESEPNFMLFIDGTGYPIVAGNTIEISDLEPGILEITEDPDANYYLGTVTINGATITETGEWSIKVEVEDGAQISVEWPNTVVTPVPTNSPTPPPTPNITPTPTPRVTPEVIRPTPQPIIPPTGDSGFIIPVIIFIISIIGIVILINKRK